MSSPTPDDRARPNAADGQVLVLFTLFLIVLLGSAGLAVDYGSWLSARRDFQAVSDAASLAGASLLPPPPTAATLPDQQHAVEEALVYLSDHLGWGTSFDRAWARGQAAPVLNNKNPLEVPGASGAFCVWVWTPTPMATDVTPTADPTSSKCMNSPGSPVNNVDPTKFQGSKRRVFVRVDSPRSYYFARILGMQDPRISAGAIAGSSAANFAIMALKPNFGPPDAGLPTDTNLGIEIDGGSTITVPEGDVGGNYSLRWNGTNSKVIFTSDQTIALHQPTMVAGNGSVINGTVDLLDDYPLEDPGYDFAGCPLSQATCSIAPAAVDPSVSGSAKCVAGTASGGTDIKCGNNAGAITLLPGRYSRIDLSGDTTATLQAGTYYFTLPTGTLSNAGFSASSTVIHGCGVLLIFDPRVQGGGNKIQMNISGTDTELTLNRTSPSFFCDMRRVPDSPGGATSYVWYGGPDTDTNPITVWVRPTGNGYATTGSSSGSEVIKWNAGISTYEDGIIYGPQDNTQIAGQGAGSGVGQIIAWTIKYAGGTEISESFQGPAQLKLRLWR